MNIQHEIWPTMITPFTPGAKSVDLGAVTAIVDFYARNGCKGIFAVCQSSEMFFLSEEERLALALAACAAADGRMEVIVSGHVSEDVETAAAHVREMAQTGAQAVILVSNRFAAQDEPDIVWQKNAERLLALTPGIALGMYECPYPYKRPLSDAVLDFCRDSGRFRFIKDTCCDTALLADRLSRIEGSTLRLYNANTATLLDSLLLGAAGYSGVMANYHPGLYVRLTQLLRDDMDGARLLQAFLTVCACLEERCYPISAKYHMQRRGVAMGLDARAKEAACFGCAARMEIDQLILLEDAWADGRIGG